ncbi:YdcF family protein [Granulicella tundricola]|uniref:DUF218 domain-containing protein n=1 Tax=Granulicella tundricola (strain ATCC BAA-1859 / DSM 23138 / MP5ACTX9) TaxID=1198114 RepID=E8X7L0_GRATM|nr:YdcF family protein [Granulicella tundricola]ADW71444.1 protein of unknown function DUF218 [Granulicella tundricola MP5ACTX9]
MRKFWLVFAVVVCIMTGMAISYLTVPKENGQLESFDAIIVIGCPTADDGTLSPMQKARVLEGVKEFSAGKAKHLIFSGGASNNHSIESQVMAQAAAEMGVPNEAVFLDQEANNTLGNIFFSHLIMTGKGWNSAEVISSQNHLPRLGVILALYNFSWQTHAAPWPPNINPLIKFLYYGREVAATTVVRWFGFRSNDLVPF